MSLPRIIFAGTPDFAVPALNALVESNINLVAVCTQPDRPAGRGRKLQASAVKMAASNHNLVVMQPASLNSEDSFAALANLEPDLMVVAAYGQILSKRLLDLPAKGCVNLHASLLPRWRGAAPIHRAIEAGDRETGVTLMQMAEGCDTGDMLAKISCTIAPNDSTATLHDKLANLGARMIHEYLGPCLDGTLQGIPQDPDLVTHAAKINRAEAKIDWHDDAAAIERRMRAFTPWPGVYSVINGQEFKIWRAQVVAHDEWAEPGRIMSVEPGSFTVACGNDHLRVFEIQTAGNQRMEVSRYQQGNTISKGWTLGR